jgi:ABC-type branched-subunit amino acid transport system substrate-binding protein
MVEAIPRDKGVLAVARGPASTGSRTAPGATAPGARSATGPKGAPKANGKSGPVTTGTSGATTKGGPRPGTGTAASLSCAAGHNGGSTDQGVTADQIKMATTVVKSGPGSSFLGDVQYAMEAVKNAVNQTGGICGRQLSIQYVDDGWDAGRGATYLRNFIHEGIFAVPVCPSSEGCSAVIESGDFDRAHIPVVGTDGLRVDQYAKGSSAQPWVWPVATATVSSARIMADWAYSHGVRHFSIVFDNLYKFGKEGADAFNAEVKRLTGQSIEGYNSQYSCVKAFCGISASQNDYSTQVAEWQPYAGDFTALFLEPGTALSWMHNQNSPPASQHQYGAAQPLFTYAFGSQCGSACDQMWVFTGFKPYIESYKNDPAVRSYVQALQRTNPQADAYNAFAEGGYVGMLLLVDALQKVGPDLTRDKLKEVLDHECLASGLTIQTKICFSPNNRFANITMQGFQMQAKGTFSGWRSGPILRDPRPGS